MKRSALTLMLVLATLLVHARVVTNDFVGWDDFDTIAGNPRMLNPSFQGLAWYWTHSAGGLYVPLTYTAWMAIATVARVTTAGHVELNPALFHAASLLLHLGSALLVLGILRRLLHNEVQAFLGAMIFALHPMQVETIAWSSGLKDLLCGFLSLAAIRFYLASVEQQSRRDYAATLVLLLLAMLAKPVAVVIPLILFALDVLILYRPWRVALKSVAPMALSVIPLAIVARVVQNAYPQTLTPIWTRPLIAADALAFYAHKILVPYPMSIVYAHTPRAVLASGSVYAIWLIPVAIVIALWLLRKRAPLFVAGLVIGALALLPVLGLTRFSMQVHSTVSDHYMYLPLFGVALAVASLVKRALGVIPLCIALVVFGALSFQQTGYWRNGLTLFSHAVEVLPENEDTQLGLGHALAEAGREEEAIAHFGKAVQVNPNGRTSRELLTQALVFRGQYAAAIPQGLQAVHLAESEPNSDTSQIHFLLGRAYAQVGDYPQAEHHLAAAAKQQPGDHNLAAELQSIRQRMQDAPTTRQ